MGLKYSIMGFLQEEALKMTKVVVKDIRGKKVNVTLKIDVADLLILRQLADFPNRAKVITFNVNDKNYFWVSYKELLAELPILGIKKQALADRIDKLVELGLLDRILHSIKNYGNMTLFRMGANYEKLLYDDTEERGYSSELREGIVENYDRGYGSELRDINNPIKDNKPIDNKESSETLSDVFVSSENSNSKNARSRRKSCVPIKDIMGIPPLDTNREREKSSAKREKFNRPSEEEVNAYLIEKEREGKVIQFTAKKFISHYDSIGWKGIVDWRAKIDEWLEGDRIKKEGVIPQRIEKPKVDEEYLAYRKRKAEQKSTHSK